ncbi:MAG: nicotinamide-nucleotide amidohydrolase family protein [Methylobacterium sp.]|uniref:CinA family protein n=1 Tax=Methylobacterium sp. TaxID=409 RepID=UPI000FA8FFBF|nr:nicotinamide-nucleotide amidohydrolase family protein [Methylobacterium sp.]RUP15780.1 MAG: nicotinamide-nucleotide amidohydrolase family protein [Methylobacterium sp.]
MIEDAALLARAEALVAAYTAARRTIATAESCTGGLVAGLLTAVPGSSAVVERGFVTYSNEAKAESIGVPMDLIRQHGAVSAPVAGAMAAGALAASRASVAVAITGIAGPGGGSAEKPVGLVHFGLAQREGGIRLLERRYGDLGRAGIRCAAVADALGLLEEAIRG